MALSGEYAFSALRKLGVSNSYQCPTTRVGWIYLRDQTALSIVQQSAHLRQTLNAGKSENLEVADEKLNENLRLNAKRVESCDVLHSPVVRSFPQLADELQHLLQFLHANRHEGEIGFELGFNVPDARYFRETSQYTSIPKELLQQDLLRAMSSPELIPNALEILARLNEARPVESKYLFFKYTSQHLPTPDDSQVYGRILIIVPGNPEKWVQFGVPEAGKTRTQNVSVVSILTGQDGNRHVFMKDHFRIFPDTARKGGGGGESVTWSEGEIKIRSRFEETGRSDNCASCHKSGVLPIFPQHGSFDPIDAPKIAEANRRFRQYGKQDFGGYLDLQSLGAGLGPHGPEADRLRTNAFLRTCTGGLALEQHELSMKKIRDSMSCSKCHNPALGGALNYPVNEVLLRSYVLGGKMPPRNDLSKSERQGLLRCLEQEYFGTGGESPSVLLNWFKSSL